MNDDKRIENLRYEAQVYLEQRNEARRWARRMRAERDEAHARIETLRQGALWKHVGGGFGMPDGWAQEKNDPQP